MIEVQGLKEENWELKLENAKLKSELLAIKNKIEYQRGATEKKEEDLQVSKQESEMFEDHSSLLALHTREVSESKELLKRVLGRREKQLHSIEIENT